MSCASTRCFPGRLKMIKECEEIIRRQVMHVQIANSATVPGRQEGKQEHEGVSIAEDRLWTQTSREGHVLREEDTEGDGEGRGRVIPHRTSPASGDSNDRKREQWRSNLSFAAWVTGSRRVR